MRSSIMILLPAVCVAVVAGRGGRSRPSLQHDRQPRRPTMCARESEGAGGATTVVIRHVFRNSLTAALSMLGLQLG